MFTFCLYLLSVIIYSFSRIGHRTITIFEGNGLNIISITSDGQVVLCITNLGHFTDGRGFLYEYGWHLEDREIREGSNGQIALSTPIRVGCFSYDYLCVSEIIIT